MPDRRTAVSHVSILSAPIAVIERRIQQEYDEESRGERSRSNLANGFKAPRERGLGGAVRYWTKAAALGDADSHYNLSLMLLVGEVEEDEEKQLYHLEEATIRGHPNARYNLACLEKWNNRFDRAVKHHIIAANLGYDLSIQALKDFYKDGLVSKEDFAAALRGHQAAVDATKSPQREAAS